MPPNTFGDYFQALTDIMSQDSDLFRQTAMRWLSVIFLAMVLYHGVRLMLYFDWRPFLRTAVIYLILLTVLLNYAAVTGVVTGETKKLSDILSNNSESVIYQTLVNFSNNVDSSLPVVPSIGQWIRYVLLEIVMLILEAAIWAIIAWGFGAIAICKILGPIFLVWALVPGWEFIAWGWARSFIQYAFYPVVATAYTLIAARVLTYFTAHHPPPYSSVDEWVMLVPATMVFGALIVGVLQIPSLTSSLFSGRAGESAPFKFLRTAL